MRQLDAFNVKYQPIASIDLMEQAAHGFLDALLRHQLCQLPHVVVFAGPNNNGGDALAVARLLADMLQIDADIEVFLFNTGKGLSADCQENKNRLLQIQSKCERLSFHEITSAFTPPLLDEKTLVIDGLFGTGLNRPLEGGFAAVVQYVNASAAVVAAIDIPSGLMAEDNADNVGSNIMQADYTFTFHAPKLAFLFPENEAYVGRWEIVDIGLCEPRELCRQLDSDAETPTEDEVVKAEQMLASSYVITNREDVGRMLKPRSRFAHKGTMGHAALVAGKKGMAGAAILAAKACMRSGVGKLTVHTQEVNRTILQLAVPEAVLDIEEKSDVFSQTFNLAPFDAIAVGPGLGVDGETTRALGTMLADMRIPLVLDADALNIIAGNPSWMQHLPRHTIITPHRGEMQRLVGRQRSSWQLLHETILLARRSNIYVVLKGRYTAVVTPEGQVLFNSTGNPGMATAGSGDVLTGVILALLSQGYDAESAARLGVYLHGLAADLAVEQGSEEGLVASDIVAWLPKAFARLYRKIRKNPLS